MYVPASRAVGARVTLWVTLVAGLAVPVPLVLSPPPAPLDDTRQASPVPVRAARHETGRQAAPGGAGRSTPGGSLRVVEMRPGDHLSGLLLREGFDPGAAQEVTRALRRRGANLRKLRSRARVEITLDPRGRPAAFALAVTPWAGFSAVATEAGWDVTRTQIEPVVRVRPVRGRVESSLFEAIDDAGESAQLVVDLVEILSSELDFTADTRRGDRFRLLVEKRYAGDLFVEYGRILVAQYESDGRVLTAVGFDRPGATPPGYYDLAGRSLRKSFLRSPLEFTRITSGFTYARPHPILGGARPHLAVDYAAPVGTPVRAVAGGTVTRAGWDGGYGISVRVQHEAGYMTMYNHLSRVRGGIRPGARVAQRQVIGYVGSTGLSTGPHLDYRVARNGIFVNPLRETFLPGAPIAPDERDRFQLTARALVRRLESEAPY
jgi:murein DD-endopeptidase MepM/ murein hydrolase activator NlpD